MDMFNKLSMPTKVVLGGTILFLIVSIFNWQEVDLGVAEAGVTMWHGWGTIAGIVALALLAWEGLRLANVNVTLPISDSMIGALLAILLAVLTIIKVLADNEFRTFWAWLGLLFALVVAAAAVMRMQAGGESFADMRRSVTSAASGGAASARGAVDRDDKPEAPAAPSTPSTEGTSDTSDDTRTTP